MLSRLSERTVKCTCEIRFDSSLADTSDLSYLVFVFTNGSKMEHQFLGARLASSDVAPCGRSAFSTSVVYESYWVSVDVGTAASCH